MLSVGLLLVGDQLDEGDASVRDLRVSSPEDGVQIHPLVSTEEGVPICIVQHMELLVILHLDEASMVDSVLVLR